MTDPVESTTDLASTAHSICALNDEVLESLTQIELDPVILAAITAMVNCNTHYIRALTASYLSVHDQITDLAKKFAPK